MSDAPATLPSYDELPLLDGVPSAWDLWGDRAALGALNLLTPERVTAAARLVTRGARFPLNLPLDWPDPPLFGRPPMRHTVGALRLASKDDSLHDWNTQGSTQWDGFRHVMRPGHGHFGGIADEEQGVHHWARAGIAGRAVLLDVARWRAEQGRPIPFSSSEPIDADDLRGCAAAQGVEVEPGDILLVRTGWLAGYNRLDAAGRAAISTKETLVSPGLLTGEEMARTLWDWHVAAVAADNPALEVWPIGAPLGADFVAEVRQDLRREHEIQLHVRILSMLGIVVGELFDLEALADDCAGDGRYTGLFTSAPLNLTGGVATPSNALVLK